MTQNREKIEMPAQLAQRLLLYHPAEQIALISTCIVEYMSTSKYRHQVKAGEVGEALSEVLQSWGALLIWMQANYPHWASERENVLFDAYYAEE